MEVAAVLGAVGGNADVALEVLESVGPDDIERTKELVAAGICSCELKEGVANLYVAAKAIKGDHYARVTIEDHHTNITKIEKDGQMLVDRKSEDENDDAGIDRSRLTLRSILDFADEVNIDDVREVLERQLSMNRAISQKGLDEPWGACVGKTLLATRGNDVITRACARAAAGSDARMSGCSLPVVINSGSGNQGLTVSMPVLTYLEPLDRAALRRILTEPKNSIIKQYVKLFKMDDVDLVFNHDVLDYIVDKAIEFKLGARGLRSITEAIMTDKMYETPSKKVKKVVITLAYAQSKIDKANANRLKSA